MVKTMVKTVFSDGKSPFFMGKSTISMAMFNSYVKLPEGKVNCFFLLSFQDFRRNPKYLNKL